MTKRYYRYDPDTGKKEWSDEVDFVSTEDVKDSTGDSTTHPMSQKATTDALNTKITGGSVVQGTGSSTADVMSQKAVTEAITPIGMCYTQYPGTETPSSLFGGTWALMFNDEGVFFRTEGQGASSFGGGVQGDAIRNITGNTNVLRGVSNIHVLRGASGVFSAWDTSSIYSRNVELVENTDEYTLLRFDFDASRVVPTAPENRPRNRTIRVWRKTAH